MLCLSSHPLTYVTRSECSFSGLSIDPLARLSATTGFSLQGAILNRSAGTPLAANQTGTAHGGRANDTGRTCNQPTERRGHVEPPFVGNVTLSKSGQTHDELAASPQPRTHCAHAAPV